MIIVKKETCLITGFVCA